MERHLKDNNLRKKTMEIYFEFFKTIATTINNPKELENRRNYLPLYLRR